MLRGGTSATGDSGDGDATQVGSGQGEGATVSAADEPRDDEHSKVRAIHADERQKQTDRVSAERTFIDGLPQAYPVHGDAAFIEPCLVVAREDGERGVRLSFVEDRIVRRDGNRGEARV